MRRKLRKADAAQSMSVALQQAVPVLRQWAEAGEVVAMHILGCAQCQMAEAAAQHRPTPRDRYCSICNDLWSQEMQCEAKVIAIWPDLPEEIRNEVPFRFRFQTEHEA